MEVELKGERNCKGKVIRKQLQLKVNDFFKQMSGVNISVPRPCIYSCGRNTMLLKLEESRWV